MRPKPRAVITGRTGWIALTTPIRLTSGHGAKLRGITTHERRRRGRTGIGDEAIDRSPRRARSADRLGHGSFIRDVGAHREIGHAGGERRVGGRRGRGPENAHAHTLLTEGAGDGATDAARTGPSPERAGRLPPAPRPVPPSRPPSRSPPLRKIGNPSGKPLAGFRRFVLKLQNISGCEGSRQAASEAFFKGEAGSGKKKQTQRRPSGARDKRAAEKDKPRQTAGKGASSRQKCATGLFPTRRQRSN